MPLKWFGWMSLRSLLQYGTERDRSGVRDQLMRIPSSVSPAQAGADRTVPDEATSTQRKPVSMISHNELMSCQQMTFNHYLFCRGFRTSIGY